MKPCVNCLGKAFKKKAGLKGQMCIIQCADCGFNRCGESWSRVEKLWNGFKVWEKVNELEKMLGASDSMFS